jgi:hypothetical protein
MSRTGSNALTRRSMISATAGAVAIPLVLSTHTHANGKVDASSGGSTRTLNVLTDLNVQAWNDHAGSSFEFWNGTGRARATLAKAIDTNVRSPDLTVYSFVLQFVVQESTRSAPDELCHVIHPKLGAFDLFVVSGHNSNGEIVLSATFSRIQ